MFRISSDGLVVDAEDDQPVALVADGFFTAEATMGDKRYLVLRLTCPGDPLPGGTQPSAQVHQFALPLEQAGDLVRAILSIASRSGE